MISFNKTLIFNHILNENEAEMDTCSVNSKWPNFHMMFSGCFI